MATAPHFVSVERLEEGKTHFYVVHTAHPRFTVEIEPEIGEDGRVTSGTVRRIVIPNSWCGGYSQPARLMADAIDYLKRTLSEGALRPGRFSA